MKLEDDLKDRFYQKLGALFYSVAAADKVVHPKEIKTLKELILKKWKATEAYKDHFGSDVIHQMEVVFDWLEYKNTAAEESFNTFKDYYLDNRSLFTPERKDLIMKTASKIAHSYADVNKSELIILSKLDQLFKD
ncbi:hypothetical protein MKO06_09610 [Gramella sp. GC03-9]|uniref:Co-chaperone DjlA N-terminal domain-containing protein n=1 Tax=Christiangramia oceanisediminis TaxID=2920386 RepID=A0A9X2KXM6_9FLAO|nr:hypothetical protein [Gramella oceanisediminis]MCP9200165.1 hypothetical protein [Gramella oceanisediminis]